MKKIGSKCWEYKGFTVFKDNYLVFPYIVYDDEGFALEAFNTLAECKGFIDGKGGK